MISGSTGPIFTKFLPYGRYLIIDYTDYRSELLFLMAKGTLWQPIYDPNRQNWALFVALTYRNRLQYRHSDFRKFIYDDLATSCKYFCDH